MRFNRLTTKAQRTPRKGQHDKERRHAKDGGHELPHDLIPLFRLSFS
jgi:hypothetical protein